MTPYSVRERKRNWAWMHRDKVRQSNRAWRSLNADKVRRQTAARMRRYRARRRAIAALFRLRVTRLPDGGW